MASPGQWGVSRDAGGRRRRPRPSGAPARSAPPDDRRRRPRPPRPPRPRPPARPAPAVPAWRSDRRSSAATSRRPGALSRRARRAESASSRASSSTVPVHRVRAQIVQAGAARRRRDRAMSTLSPSPTTTAHEPADLEFRLGQHAGQLRLPHQEVVGPLEHRLHARPPGGRPPPRPTPPPRYKGAAQMGQTRAGTAPKRAGRPPEATPSGGPDGPVRRSDGRPLQPFPRRPHTGLRTADRRSSSRSRRTGARPRSHPTWQTP